MTARAPSRSARCAAATRVMVGSVRTWSVAVAPVLLLAAGQARADEPAATPELTAEQAAKVDLTGGEKKASISAEEESAPPPPPRKKGFVIESSLGALGWLGKFGSVAPPAFWLHAQLGWEIFRWLMVFGDGELAFTQTSYAVDPTKNRAVPIFGFGGGLRATVHFTDRVAMYVQGNAGAMMADVPIRALAVMGYANAENLSFTAGGRLGLEWYQLDPHVALALSGGPRFAPGFARTVGGDLPLMLDGEASLRYTF